MTKLIYLFRRLLPLAALLVLVFPAAGSAQDDDAVLNAMFHDADNLMDAGKYDEAIVLYNKIMKLAPDNKNVYNGRGNAYLEKGQYQLAIKDFDKNLELDEDDFYAYYGRGAAYYRLGEYQKSVDDHTKELELQSNRALGYFGRANAYVKLNKLDEALSDYGKSISSSSPAGYLERSSVFQLKGDVAAAIADLRYYLRIIPDDTAARERLLHLGVNASELPPTILRKEENVPAEARKLFAAAIADIGQTEYDRAMIGFTKAVEIYPNFAAAFYYRGYLNEMLGFLIKYRQSLGDYFLAIMYDPKSATMLERRAYLYIFNTQKAKGGADLNKALLLNPRSAQAYLYRGMYFQSKAKAMLDIDRAIKLDPNYADAYLGRAEMFEDRKQYAKAVEDYTAVTKINLNDARAYKGRAEAYCKLKKPDLAAADEKRYLQLGGEIETPCGGE